MAWTGLMKPLSCGTSKWIWWRHLESVFTWHHVPFKVEPLLTACSFSTPWLCRSSEFKRRHVLPVFAFRFLEDQILVSVMSSLCDCSSLCTSHCSSVKIVSFYTVVVSWLIPSWGSSETKRSMISSHGDRGKEVLIAIFLKLSCFLQLWKDTEHQFRLWSPHASCGPLDSCSTLHPLVMLNVLGPCGHIYKLKPEFFVLSHFKYLVSDLIWWEPALFHVKWLRRHSECGKDRFPSRKLNQSHRQVRETSRCTFLSLAVY